MRRLLAAFALLVVSAVPALADGFIVIAPPPAEPRLRQIPLWVRSHVVSVRVEGRVAVTDVDQVFVNPNPRAVEGTYLFPLPDGAAIDRFSMWIDGKETPAELVDAGKARAIYEDIVRKMRDPALLEYAGRGVFQARIFPIDANGEKRVRVRYAEVLASDNGTVGYRYPLNTEKFSSRPLENVAVSVSIDAGGPITGLFSPSHKIEQGAAGDSGVARVGWEARDVTPDRDIVVYWRPTQKDVGVSLIAHRDPSDPDGTFLLVLSPRPDVDAKPLAKDVVFVVDTSGSMAGPKMEQAKAALRYCIRSLGDGDRFALVPFSTEPRPFRDALVAADAANRAAAEKFVDAMEAAGGTAIDDALRVGLDMLPGGAEKSARPAIVLFVTDGLPTIGETDVEKILKHAKERAPAKRLFAFGVGDDVNTKLLDRLAAENRGARDYVASAESIEEKVSNLYAKLAKPAMTDLELVIDGVATSAVHPRRLPDLFHGGEILVAGRYAKGGDAVIRLRGKVGGDAREIVEEVKFPDVETRHEFLPRLWAVRRVGFLLDELRLHGETAEVRDETVRLARRFGIVTPYTSWLILEDETRRAGAPRPGFGGGPSTGGGGGGAAGKGSSRPPTPEEAIERELLAAAADQAKSAAGADSGAGAVDLSREGKGLADFEGDKDDKKADERLKRIVRHVGGRTFVSQGGVWFDADVDVAKPRRAVEQFSDAWFELARLHPETASWLKLGRAVFALGDEIVEITAAP